MGWKEIKEAAKAKAAKAKEAAGNVAKKTGEVAKGAVEKAGDAVGKGKEAVEKTDFGKLRDRFKGAAVKFGEVSKAGMERAQGALKDDLNSEASQKFIDQAGDKLQAARPLGKAVADSLKDMSQDPETLMKLGVQGLGTAVLTGGMNIPASIAMEVMKDPEVRNTFSELLPVDVDKFEKISDVSNKISAVSNNDLANVMKDPSMRGVLQTAMDNPKIQGLMKEQMQKMTAKPEVDADAAPAADKLDQSGGATLPAVGM